MSHIYPKGRYRNVEYDPRNVKALCYACHLHFWHKNPIEAHEWLKTVRTASELETLKLAANSYGGKMDYNLTRLYLESEVKRYGEKVLSKE